MEAGMSAPRSSLTPREIQALQMAADGYTIERAARALGVSWASVRSARRRAKAKLGTDDITEAVAIAYRLGIVDGG